MSSNIILNHSQILRKLERLAWQILENNLDSSTIILSGIDERGGFIAQKLQKKLQEITQDKYIILALINLDRQNLIPEIKIDSNLINNNPVIIIDDVINSGTTVAHCFNFFIQNKAEKVELLVLASRSHRKYPIQPNYIGLDMATTFHEHLLFDNTNEDNLSLTLS